MFDIGWSELLIIAVVALVVIGPKDLPHAIYNIGKWVRKARLVARDFQGHIDDMMREAELDDLRKQALKARDLNIQQMMENQLDPKNELKNAFDVSAEMSAAAGHPGSPPEDAPAPPPAPAVEPPVPAGDATKPAAVSAATPHPAATDKPA
ncbi:MAG TPA: Sec-independent protein translocase protein TatB [Azospirillum sp.]|nr:Sec-independent protein translocase protein TatB [Azospirillum sp.]